MTNTELFHVDITDSSKTEVINYVGFARQSCALLIGSGGTGKSMFMKNSFLQSLNIEKYSIFIDLINYNGETLCEIVKHNIECKGYSVSEELILQLLYRGEFQLFLDGFDEIRDNEIDHFLSKCIRDSYLINNKFYISSRNIDNLNHLKCLNGYSNKFYMNPLSKDTIISIILKYTNSEYERNTLNDHLTDSKIKVLLKPLYLGMLINYLESNNNLIELIQSFENDYELLSYLMNNILNWNDKKVNNFTDEIKYILPIIAFKATQNYKLLITEKEFNEYIKNGLNELGVEIDLGYLSKLKKIIINYGFIEKQNDGLYKFEHKNFQDYFVAKYLLSTGELELTEITSNLLFEDSFLLIAKYDIGYIEDRLSDMSIKLLDNIYAHMDNTTLSSSARRCIKKWFANKYEEDITVKKAYCNVL
ncbi:NACHT domain-containing protein [Bacillus cereus]